MDLKAMERRMMMLLLGASDMYQVEEAGLAILDELDKEERVNLMLARALEDGPLRLLLATLLAGEHAWTLGER